MKIALVCPYNMFERAGGVQQLVIHLAEGLRKKGHEVKIITPKPPGFNGEVPEGTVLLGNSTKFNLNPGLGTAGAWTFDISDKEVKELIDNEHFDVINFHEPWAPLLARQILNRSTEAHVGTFHGNYIDSVAGKSLVNVFLPYGRGIGSKMQVFTAVSSAPAAVLISKSKNNNSKHRKLVKNIKYIPNGIDLKVYRAPKKRQPLSGPGTKTIVYIGRLERRKGVDWLIKAFGELVKEMPNAYLLIAGDGNRRQQLEELIEAKDIPNINFLGYISDEQKRHLLGNADVFCSPAMFGESFGIVLLEAMAMGVPVIAGNNIGYASVLKGHGRLGLVDSESTLDLANRLAVVIQDKTVHRLLSNWGLAEVKQYDYPKVVDQYEAAYKEALAIMRQERNGKKSSVEGKNGQKKFIHRLFIRRHA